MHEPDTRNVAHLFVPSLESDKRSTSGNRIRLLSQGSRYLFSYLGCERGPASLLELEGKGNRQAFMGIAAAYTLPENLARMAASEFILDPAIRFKLGCAPPSESLTDSNSVAKRPGR
ncbi:hypothetical protein PCASD_08690 [Puccinia coronata f. sp. avenae]|uniref:Uncharacterized protein n=1 Tax=Puccinia coronata f. sp. avenae TaxID=200324 RepID=A0A2N5UG54_9BASI|nr:hypothetical protein PCASD_08690 [Puccinia coronata f. sp. avenae]